MFSRAVTAPATGSEIKRITMKSKQRIRERKYKKNVIPRHGEWPFLPGVDIIKSDYVDPLGTDTWAKSWRRIHLGDRNDYRLCLYGIIERFLLKTEHSDKIHVAWIQRDLEFPHTRVNYINDSWPLELLQKRKDIRNNIRILPDTNKIKFNCIYC